MIFQGGPSQCNGYNRQPDHGNGDQKSEVSPHWDHRPSEQELRYCPYGSEAKHRNG